MLGRRWKLMSDASEGFSSIFRLKLIKLKHDGAINGLGIDQLLVEEVFVFAHCLEASLEIQNYPLVVFVHLVELEGLLTEPVSLVFHIDEAGLLLGLDPLNRCLFFEVTHVFLHDVHLLLKGGQKVVLMLIHYFFDELTSVLVQRRQK